MHKKFELLYTDCIQQFQFFPAHFARQLFIPPLLNFFRYPCLQCDCKRLKTNIGISRENISQGKRLILSWKSQGK